MALIVKILFYIFVATGSAFWLIQLFFTFKVIRKVKCLGDVEYDDVTRWPKMSVIVPARNEEKTIEKAVRSRLKDDYPDVEILLINDRSTDKTGEIIDKLVSEDSRVKAVHIKELPDGWVGKLFAMHTGAEHAAGEWFLFSDADVHIGKDTLKRCIAYCMKNDLGHFSIFPEFLKTNLILDSVISFFIKALVMLGRIWEIGDEKSKVGIAAGAFNMVKKTAYEKTGGFKWLKQEVTDDISFGQMLKKSGARTAVLNGRDYVKVTIYESLKGMSLGLERGTGSFRFINVALLCVFALAYEIFPVIILLPFGIPYLFIWGVFMTVVSLYVSIVLNRWLNRPALPSFFYPLGAALFFFLFFRGGFLGLIRGGVYWRGTFYPTKELRKGRRLKLKFQ
jgi:cellulose synthase/poly-beta-1,6-N-acetylglucosamine synthase-like glycosyltransferase